MNTIDFRMVERVTRERKLELEAAERYIRSERSDPFARNRAMSHIRNGITRPFFEKESRRVEVGYDATETRETRSYVKNGVLVEYEVPAFINVKRP